MIGVKHNYKEEYLNIRLSNGFCSEFDSRDICMTHYFIENPEKIRKVQVFTGNGWLCGLKFFSEKSLMLKIGQCNF